MLAPVVAAAQTQIPLPAQTGTFSGNVRGYWFTSPSNFVITGLRVPTDASSGAQSIELVRLDAAPPTYSATTNSFTSLFRVVDDATTNILPVSIPVASGDIIGVLGSRAGVTSYASVAPYTTTIDGQNVTLQRLGMQFPLATTPAQQLWTEAAANIGRIEIYYLPGFVVTAAASPTVGGTVTCAASVVATGATTSCTATANAGYTLTGISGCNGTPGSTSPYTTGPVSAACTVTATFANDSTIGGTVSGLAGSGLVLSLNAGAQTLPVAANGSFTFPTALASGSPYNVTVQTQPGAPTQTCAVANGSGTTTGGTNVTNVTVSCTTNTYSVGGTVSGLSGAGLVLSLNAGAQTMNIAANGAFSFPTALASGASYAVTVQTQPGNPTQTCSVTNGSGTVTSSNVSNVAVTCSTNTYSVGGTVSGLAGSGMVLSLNAGGQTLNVASNGAFAFPVALTSGSNYAVTVQTQPGSPAQSCVVTSGSGTVTSANITNVSVACTTALRAISVLTGGASFTTSPPIPSTVPDGTVLSFTITMVGGATLQSVTGCGGTLVGSVYTTAPITANCTIAVNGQVLAIPALAPLLLALLASMLAAFGMVSRRNR